MPRAVVSLCCLLEFALLRLKRRDAPRTMIIGYNKTLVITDAIQNIFYSNADDFKVLNR